MAKLIYSAAMSLDGFIAGPGGSMDWLSPYAETDGDADDLAQRTGSMLVGARTFRGDDPHRGTDLEGTAFSGAWSGPQVILTHLVPPNPLHGLHFVDDVGRAISLARELAGDADYVNVLGAQTARQCLEAGELDEVLTVIVPVLLGDGVRLFERVDGDPVRLERVSVETSRLNTTVWMRVLG